MTTLHITHNDGTGSKVLCGAPRRQTYRMLDEGTADRYIDAALFGSKHNADSELCQICLESLENTPKTLPDWFIS